MEPGAKEAVDYFEAIVTMLARLLDWKNTHDQHDHADAVVRAVCVREWRYLEHQSRVLLGSGPV